MLVVAVLTRSLLSRTARGNRSSVSPIPCMETPVFRSISSAKETAFSTVRLAIVIDATPLSANATTTALAAPPAPKTMAFSPTGTDMFPSSSKAFKTPGASVLSPYMFPSTNVSVFTAPMSSASREIDVTDRMTACLCGSVTLMPTTLIALNPAIASAKSSGRT